MSCSPPLLATPPRICAPPAGPPIARQHPTLALPHRIPSHPLSQALLSLYRLQATTFCYDRPPDLHAPTHISRSRTLPLRKHVLASIRRPEPRRHRQHRQSRHLRRHRPDNLGLDGRLLPLRRRNGRHRRILHRQERAQGRHRQRRQDQRREIHDHRSLRRLAQGKEGQGGHRRLQDYPGAVDCTPQRRCADA